MFDINSLMGKMKDVQEKIKVAQENLEQLTYSAEAGAGMVKATVNGRKKVLAIDIAPELLVPAEKKTAEDLVVAAINLALEGIDPQIQSEMRNATGGVNPMDIAGIDLSNLFG